MSNRIDYLSDVQMSLKRAKELLSDNNDQDLKYVALELRMCIEGIVYEDLQSYPKDCLPEKALTTWQPDRVVKYILSVDPNYLNNGVLILAPKGQIIDPDGEVQLEKMRDLGAGLPEEWRKFTQTNLNRKITKKMYHSLGSALHVPTLRQKEAGVSLEKQRATCEEIVLAIEARLAANLGAFTLWANLAHECVQCSISNVFHVLKSIEPTEQLFDCCGEGCNAQYAAVEVSKDTYDVRPWGQTYKCDTCDEFFIIWERELRLANRVRCSSCGELHVIGFGAVSVKRAS